MTQGLQGVMPYSQITNSSRDVLYPQNSITIDIPLNTYDYSPIRFQNYLAISYNAGFANTFFIDNSFFVSRTFRKKQNQYDNHGNSFHIEAPL